MSRKKIFSRAFLWVSALGLVSIAAFAASAVPVEKPPVNNQVLTLWSIIASGGVSVIFLGFVSIAAVASIIYHFRYVTVQRLAPADFSENLLFLLEKKEYEKAIAVCRQQQNMISAIALQGLQKLSRGKAVIELAIQNEGKKRIEKLWQNLTYLGDLAVIAPMLGLLGTILGMIDAFNFFKAGTVHPGVLTQGLAKAMINTAFGLVIAVPCLVFYSYFRGKVSSITSQAESVASEIIQAVAQ
jgi:biopolymer transport protein ExbB